MDLKGYLQSILLKMERLSKQTDKFFRYYDFYTNYVVQVVGIPVDIFVLILVD